MKYLAALLLCAAALAQQTRTTYTFDVNGDPVPGASVSVSGAPHAREQRTVVSNLNGGRVPVNSVEERVVSEEGNLRIVERVVKRYDANGVPGPAEKIRIEERKNADGSVTMQTTVLRGDLNGNFRAAERSTTVARTSGGTSVFNTTVERPGLGAAFEPVERIEQMQVQTPGGGAKQNSTIYRLDSNGQFFEAARQASERTLQDGRLVENATFYEAQSPGQMQLLRQTLTTTTKSPDGSEMAVTDVYEPQLPGRAGPAGGEPKLREQRVVGRTSGPDGAVETVSVRRSNPSNPGTLGNLIKVQETVCTGDCK